MNSTFFFSIIFFFFFLLIVDSVGSRLYFTQPSRVDIEKERAFHVCGAVNDAVGREGELK